MSCSRTDSLEAESSRPRMSTPPSQAASTAAGAAALPAPGDDALLHSGAKLPTRLAAAEPRIQVAAEPAAAPAAADQTKTDHQSGTRKSPWETLGRIVSQATNRTAIRPLDKTNRPAALSDLSSDQVAGGLKEALARGLNHAVIKLGTTNGFLANPSVRIPIPERLQTVEKFMRRVGQDKLADEFVATMNRAAEKAVPAATSVFADSLSQMTVDDAHGILRGPSDAATQYFRRTAGPQLVEKFKPIVAEATAQTGVTAAYKQLLDRAGFASALFRQESLDLDGYVTTKAADGLFLTVAEEEKRIRENPAARTTEVLRSVFGAAMGHAGLN